jgi:iron complex outermembrane receptor protein
MILRSLLAALAIVALPRLLRAQDSTMHGALVDSAGLPEVIVTATRMSAPIADVPYAVSVAERPEFAQGMSLAETLSLVPGVRVDNRLNFAVGDRVAVRGLGARSQFGVRGVRIIVDGVPATFADGQSSLEGIDPGFVERAEIVRGPASMLYGNAAGGAIVMSTDGGGSRGGVTRSADGGPTRYYARLERSFERMAARYLFSHIAFDGWREHSDASVWRHVLRVDFGTPRSLDGAIDTTRVRVAYSTLDASNPGSLTRAVADSAPRAANHTNVVQGTGKDLRQIEVCVSGDRSYGIGELTFAAWYINRDVTNPIVGRTIRLGRDALGARTGFTAVALDSALRWSAGVDYDRQFDDRRNVAPQASGGAILLDQREDVQSVGPYVLLRLRPREAIELTGALRFDAVRFQVDDRLIDSAGGDESGVRTMTSLSPSLGITWHASDALSFFANAATGFETPTTTELANRPDGSGGFNPELEPQRSLSVELGARVRAMSIAAELVAYRMTIAGELIPFEDPAHPGRDFYRNAGSALHRGLEASIEVAPLRGLGLRASATLVDARFRQFVVGDARYDGNRVPGVAPLALAASARYGLAGASLSIEVRHQNGTPADDANTATVDGYTIVDARVGYAGFVVGPPLARVALVPYIGVDNVADTPYTASIVPNAAGARYYEPGRGRTLYGGVELRLAE